MKKLKKLKENFKNHDLKGKIRMVLWPCLVLCGIVIVWVGIWLVIPSVRNRSVEKNVEKQECKNMICERHPINSDYHLLEYDNGKYRIARSADNEELGDLFLVVKYADVTGDSLIITKELEKGCRLFSLRTGILSDYYDGINEPDSKHHLCACTQNGHLGFLDGRTGKLAIPMKFSSAYHPSKFFSNVNHYAEQNTPLFKFIGDYCIVPTTCFTKGVIDYTGKVLIDGYDEIEYFAEDTLFKTYEYKNGRYSLFDGKNMKPLFVDQKGIPILPIGVIHPEGGVLTNSFCTDTLTDLIFEDYYDSRLYKFLSDHDFMEVHYDDKFVYDETGIEVERVFKGDKTYYTSGYREEWGDDDIGVGVEEGKTGRPVIEPQWDHITIYKNVKKNKYVFCCELGGYTFLLKENGDYVTRNSTNF